MVKLSDLDLSKQRDRWSFVTMVGDTVIRDNVESAKHDAALISRVLLCCGQDRDDSYKLAGMYVWVHSDKSRYIDVSEALRKDYWADDSHFLDELDQAFDEFEQGMELVEVSGSHHYAMGCGYAEYECPNGGRISHDWDDLWASNDSLWKFEDDRCKACCELCGGQGLRQWHPCWKSDSGKDAVRP